MKKFAKIVLGLLIIGMLIFYISDFLCQAEVKCKNCPQISADINLSKRNEFYIGNYKPDKDIIKLKNYDEKITLKNVWTENSWIRNTDNCSCPKLEKTKGYNIVIEFKRNKQDFIFSLMPITEDKLGKKSFGLGKNRKEMHFENLPVNLKMIIEERNPDENVGWQKSIVTDTIVLNLDKN